jgi:hypothetical protein
MKATPLLLAFPSLFLFACGHDARPTGAAANKTAQQPAAAQPAGAKVVETMNTGGYTYVLLDNGSRQTWFAVPECKVAVGEMVGVTPGALEMRNFASPTLNRTFDVIYFAGGLHRAGADVAAAATPPQSPHGASPQGTMPHGMAQPEPAAAAPIAVAKAEGGHRVAEVWALGKAGTGQQITLRGKVVRYTGNVLGKNWLHVQDGSGTAGKDNDITVTTDATAKVGDTVLITATLAADRDFGAGYAYALLLENAKVTIE